MHLKSLTLKGFKSFASATTLRFEPGITAIVGPNGSGKSNVVDAMAWVLGEQGAKALRGGKMDDVIFAGTADRPPLGRAEVTLTIDNRDGALPVDFSEVSITRRMFRDGAGEYELNGKACRLLDIQELLSDSGIGREMHVIVSQGHLDAVLQARPEDRRAFIEEAAGVLKHRKRKEKALRKLDAMQVNLTRLTDLTAELRRQLGPLGRQAEVARRAVGVQAELRDCRLRLLADDIATLRTEMEADAEAEAAAAAYRAEVQQQLASATATGDRAAADLAAATPALTAAQNVFFSLSALVERFRGTLSLAEERARHLAAPLAAAPTGRDPEELLAEAERADAEHAEKLAAVGAADETLQAAVARRAELEAELAVAQAELTAAARAAADRREGLALLAGKVGSARSRLAAGRDELERLATAIADAAERADVAERDFAELRDSIGALDSSEVDLDALHEAAQAAYDDAQVRVAELTAAGRELTSQQGALQARADALALGLDRRDGARALLSSHGGVPGLLGSVAALVEVTPGAEAAIAAALGPAADAVAAGSVEAAARALERLQETDAGRAGIVVGGADVGIGTGGTRGTLPPGATWASSLVSAPAPLAATVDALLDGVVLVDGLAEATALVTDQPALTAVTRDGDLLGARWAFGGSRGKQSALEIQAAVDDAQAQLADLSTAVAANEAARADAVAHADRCRAGFEASLAALHESDAKISAISEQLAQLGSVARAARAEVTRLQERRTQAEAALEETGRHVAELEARLAAAESDDGPEDGDPARRDGIAAALDAQRQVELDARLSLRTAEERARSEAGAAERLRRAASSERAARAAAEQAAMRRAVGARIAERVAAVAGEALRRLERSVDRAAEERAAQEAARAAAEQAVTDARRTLAELQSRWDELTDSVHSTEVLRAGQRLKLEQLADVAQAEFSVTVDDLLGEYGPQVPMPPSPEEIAEFEAARERGETVTAPIAMPFDRASTERRAKRAARDFAALGRINPLALEEFSAMEERYAFLATQLEDLKSTRKDLLAVIDEVDVKILELFASAYHDVAAEFGTVFAALFPGGEGSLQLTDPDDMLATGIEVLARPPGKKVKRLSLLSGGERSLVAVALLVAIFRARPSPFYVLDEVEAALDEVNLTRLVGLLRELKTASQLLIITHQKYTMEAADVLYGVSMRGDGISQVISQRMTGTADDTARGADSQDGRQTSDDADGEEREQGHAVTAGVRTGTSDGTTWAGETTES